ncbi:hypothetical protein C5167_007784 [Papaver somniferum]|nr:hypothetical protein C5167_007784 [Papaver somniferum]
MGVLSWHFFGEKCMSKRHGKEWSRILNLVHRFVPLLQSFNKMVIRHLTARS